MKSRNKSKFTITFFIFISIALLFFDLGNVNAIRQGTEGFYLRITQEMFENNSFLTPLIYGAPHWSKPPLQFWLPQPLYWLTGGNFLLMGRLSILVFSLFSVLLISRWYEDTLKRNWYECFSFLIIPVYFIKYSRIFMMEMTLSYLSTLAVLYYFSYFKKTTNKNLFIASAFAGLSVLIKGPVSLAMIFPSLFLYTVVYKKKVKPFFLFALISLIIGSSWFIASYLRHGYEFIEYFFIRENLGKFTARNYPVTSVIQGLIIFTLPIGLLIPFILKGRKSISFQKDFLIYLGLTFIFFYFLWFLPKQKSHHYAVPAIPIFIIIIAYLFFQLPTTLRGRGLRFLENLQSSLVVLGMLLVAFLFYFSESLNFTQSDNYLSGAFFITASFFYTSRFKNMKLRLIRLILPLILFWQFIIPMGILPIVPNKALELSQQRSKQNIFVNYRKPFFVEESLNRNIKLIVNKNFSDQSIRAHDLVFTSLKDLEQYSKANQYKILTQWKVWIRGSDTKEIFYALKNQDLSSLQERYVLAERLD